MSIWWIDKPFLAGSHHPDEALLQALAKQGFSQVVSFLDKAEQPLNYNPSSLEPLGLSFYEFPVRDFTAPDLAQLEDFIELMKVSKNKKVLLHCQGGKGRTGTFAAAFLIALKAYSVEDAIEYIRQLEPAAIETVEQEHRLRLFEKSLVADLFKGEIG